MANVPSTSWDETTPPGSESKSNGDNRIRELKTQIREVVDVEHKFDSSGQSTEMGIHGKGSARAYYQSADPTLRPDGTTTLDANDDGRIFVDSDDKITKVWNGTAFSNIELNVTAGVTPGTATASKALIVDANKDIDLDTGDFTCTNLTVEGTLTLPNDSIKDSHIDWGTGAGQVSTDDIPEGSTNRWSQPSYDSGLIDLSGHSDDTEYSVAHGLGVAPSRVEVYWNDGTYTYVIATGMGLSNTNGTGVRWNATNIYYGSVGNICNGGYLYTIGAATVAPTYNQGSFRFLAWK